MSEPKVVITACRVDTAEGVAAARIDLVEVGGGSQMRMVDGAEEETVHPRSTVFHVRLLSPDPMLPDVLREADTYDEACQLAVSYAGRLAEHAGRIAELAKDLQV